MDPRLASLMGLLPQMAPPMMQGAPQAPQAMGVQQPAFPHTPYNPSIMERLFPDNGMEGLLGREAMGGLRRQGLLQAGLAMLANSGESTDKRGLLQILGQGLQSGQQGYQNALGGALGQRQVLAQEERQKALAAISEKHAPVEGETPAQRNNRLAKMVVDLIRFDPSLAGQLNAFAPLFRPEEAQRERNIDPRSPEGIAAEKELINYRTRLEASLRAEPKDKPLTEGERKAAVLLEIAEPSAAALDAFDAPDRLRQYAGQKGINEVLDSESQALNTHSLAVADAYIRLTSGANAPEPEVQRAFQMIAPRAGDTAKTLQLKREMRQRMVSALRLAARQETPRGRSAAKAAGDSAAPAPNAPAPNRPSLADLFRRRP